MSVVAIAMCACFLSIPPAPTGLPVLHALVLLSRRALSTASLSLFHLIVLVLMLSSVNLINATGG